MLILTFLEFTNEFADQFLNLLTADNFQSESIPNTKLWIEHIKNYPYPRDELIIKVKTLIDEIQLLKGLKDISRGYIYNSQTGFNIYARTPDSTEFDKWLEFVWQNIDSFSDNEILIYYKDFLRLKRYL